VLDFITRHSSKVIGVLKGFDRVLFRGYLSRLNFAQGVESFLWRQGALKKDFGVTLPIQYFDRVARSEKHAAGVVTEDIHLTYNSQRASGVYTVWLPKNYNPHRAYPMVLALHGTWNGLGGIGEGHTFVKHFTYAETKKWAAVVKASGAKVD